MDRPFVIRKYVNFYQDKIESLKAIFDTQDIILGEDEIQIGKRTFPVLQDVIILLDSSQYTDFIRKNLATKTASAGKTNPFAEDIQYTFGAEWERFPKMLPEYAQEFSQYFDLVDLGKMKTQRVCDLGCGTGRWSYFLKDQCRELVLVDFSDAIFVARRNLGDAQNCLFFMGDVYNLPFKNDFCDFLFCIGVLHHLPKPCLEAARELRPLSPLILIFLYYALDNRPFYFRFLLRGITAVRFWVSKIRSRAFRSLFTLFGTLFIYQPLILLGELLKPLKLSSYVPLYDFYHAKSFKRIQQDVYDRFFTRIEQRVTQKQVQELTDTYSEVTVSKNLPFWHFLCRR